MTFYQQYMKNDILRKIDHIYMEEQAIRIYAKHLQAALLWSDLRKDKKKNIIENLQHFNDASLSQLEMLNQIKSTYYLKLLNDNKNHV